eukprot:gene23242-biopygen4302
MCVGGRGGRRDGEHDQRWLGTAQTAEGERGGEKGGQSVGACRGLRGCLIVCLLWHSERGAARSAAPARLRPPARARTAPPCGGFRWGKRLGTRPGRVRFFKFYRVGCVRCRSSHSGRGARSERRQSQGAFGAWPAPPDPRSREDPARASPGSGRSVLMADWTWSSTALEMPAADPSKEVLGHVHPATSANQTAAIRDPWGVRRRRCTAARLQRLQGCGRQAGAKGCISRRPSAAPPPLWRDLIHPRPVHTSTLIVAVKFRWG